MNETHRKSGIAVIDRNRIATINAKELQPWIKEYQALGDDFEPRNALAFRYVNSGVGMGWYRLSLLAADEETPNEAQRAIVHFAAASYTHLSGPPACSLCLNDNEPRIVTGLLLLLATAKELQSNGSDRAWPKTGPLDPKRLPKQIVAVLQRHPALAISVARTLEAYGPLALKEAGKLLPLLLSEDAAVVAAARSAIRRMDPEGLARIFDLMPDDPLTPTQRERIREHLNRLPMIDLRESDGSPQSELSRRYEELWQYLPKEMAAGPHDIEDDWEIACRFRDQHLEGDWWRVLSSAIVDPEFQGTQTSRYLQQLASALYTQAGAPKKVFRLLKNDDSKLVGGMLCLIAGMHRLALDQNSEFQSDLVDPTGMPQQIAHVLERHPQLSLHVALCLEKYGPLASVQSNALVPLLLPNDPPIVLRMKRTITVINPDLAEQLDISTSQLEYAQQTDVPIPLTFGQREKIQAYLRSLE